LELELLLEFELELLLEFELELLLELELEFELLFELWLLLELELWLLLELELWLLLEFELWLELVFELVFEDVCEMRLIVRRFETARARHHPIGLPSIVRSVRTVTVTTRVAGSGRVSRAAVAGSRTIGASVLGSCDRADSGPTAEPTARPRAPNAPA
jgi:hypothetical protein